MHRCEVETQVIFSVVSLSNNLPLLSSNGRIRTGTKWEIMKVFLHISTLLKFCPHPTLIQWFLMLPQEFNPSEFLAQSKHLKNINCISGRTLKQNQTMFAGSMLYLIGISTTVWNPALDLKRGSSSVVMFQPLTPLLNNWHAFLCNSTNKPFCLFTLQLQTKI